MGRLFGEAAPKDPPNAGWRGVRQRTRLHDIADATLELDEA